MAVINLVPSASYRVQVQRVVRAIDPLPVPEFPRAPDGVVQPTEARVACQELQAAITSMEAVDEEGTVPAATRELQRRRDGACDNSALIERANQLLSVTTRVTRDPIVVARGVDVRVTVTRLGSEAPWVALFETGSRGEWRTAYGFAFTIDPWNSRYYAQATAVADSFIVTRERRTRWMDFVPTLFYSWMPQDGLNRSVSGGVTMGLGFDSSRPVVLAGGQMTYNQNISISLGGAFHAQDVLNGRYQEGGVLRENLGTEQLHERRYRLSPYISISLRSLTNPFQRPSETTRDETPRDTLPTDGGGRGR